MSRSSDAEGEATPRRVRIIGLGNTLRGDDGVGPVLVERLESLSLPPGVEVIDGGTGGLTLLSLLEGAGSAIIIDAAEFGRTPGSVLRVAGNELACFSGAPSCVPHHAGIDDALALGRELGVLPELVLLLVQAGSLGLGEGLSLEVARCLPLLVTRVCREARRLVGLPTYA